MANEGGGAGSYVAGDLTAQTTTRIQDAFDLFGAKPSHSIFQRSWSPDAIFEDPICFATGERQYKAQWWGMPAAFSKSELLSWHVEKDDPQEIRYVQKQRYTVKGLGLKKEMLSTVVMKLDQHGRIIHFQDRWDGKDMPTNVVAMTLRRLNALVMPYLITVPSSSAKEVGGRKEL
ncbi:hypothetical protein CBS101457_001542 [Exobasidium rhododendri]|nr:hypothetical protein CBS101457_001542 [Exobasidium rhododendri]